MSTFHDLIENKLRKHMGDMDIFSQLFNYFFDRIRLGWHKNEFVDL